MTEGAPLLAIAQHRAGETLRFVLAGELDEAGAPELSAAVALAAASGVTSILFDLAELTYMDSAGLKVLATADSLLRGRSERPVVVVNASRMATRILTIVGYGDLLKPPAGEGSRVADEQDRHGPRRLQDTSGSWPSKSATP